jgi:hypothetical protein
VSKKQHEPDLRVERVEAERLDGRAVRLLGHGELELDAVGAGGQRQHRLEVFVLDRAGRGMVRHARGAGVTAPHPRGWSKFTARNRECERLVR